MPPLHNSRVLAITDDYWDGHHRVRHLMPKVWAAAGNEVLWLEQTPFPDHFRRPSVSVSNASFGSLREVEPRLHVGTMPPAFPRMLKGGVPGNCLRSVHRPWDVARIGKYLQRLGWQPDIVVLFQQPVRHDLLSLFPKAVKIYYCSDIYGFGKAEAGEIEEEIQCCRKVDVIFTTSEALQQRLAEFNPRAFHIPHAVDLEWYERYKEILPSQFSKISGPRCVFTGVIFDRLDFDLLREVATLRRDWQFILVGPVSAEHPGSQRMADSLAAEPNIHFLGACKREEIPGFIASADALMIPFRRRPVAENLGLPLKFYEYGASGKPVLSTNFGNLELPHPEMAQILEDPESWSRTLSEIAAHPERQQALSPLRREIASRNTYEARLARQREILASIPHP